MHEFWTVRTAHMTYIKSQNYTIMVVGEHGIQTFIVMVVVVLLLILLFYDFISTISHPISILDK